MFVFLQYWYTTESIIAKPALVGMLSLWNFPSLAVTPPPSLSLCSDLFMKLLFELTELDFQLNLDHSSFLDETWTIPVSSL